MRSRFTRPAIMGLLVLLLVAGSAPIIAGADDEATESRALAMTDLVAYGTAWVPEIRPAFQNWKPYGWGLRAKIRPTHAGTYQWVHIPIPYIPRGDGAWSYFDLAQVCISSSAPAQTRPTDIHLWSDSGRFYTGAVTGWNTSSTGHQCLTVDIGNVWKESLGISVRIYFASADHQITLYKAWARIVP